MEPRLNTKNAGHSSPPSTIAATPATCVHGQTVNTEDKRNVKFNGGVHVRRGVCLGEKLPWRCIFWRGHVATVRKKQMSRHTKHVIAKSVFTVVRK